MHCCKAGVSLNPQSSNGLVHLFQQDKETYTARSYVQSDCFVCHQPLLIDPPDAQTLCDRMITLYSAAVLYNIALCHHGEGLHGHTREIRKALFLYDNCAILLREITGSTSLFVQILALNNMASCHYELADLDAANMKIREMAPIIGASDDQGEFMVREVMDELIFNAMSMKSRPFMPARAA